MFAGWCGQVCEERYIGGGLSEKGRVCVWVGDCGFVGRCVWAGVCGKVCGWVTAGLWAGVCGKVCG